MAEEFTREGLLDAMRKRHSYGATDNIVLDYRLKTDDNESRISILALARPQYTPALPRIPSLFALHPAHHLRR